MKIPHYLKKDGYFPLLLSTNAMVIKDGYLQIPLSHEFARAHPDWERIKCHDCGTRPSKKCESSPSNVRSSSPCNSSMKPAKSRKSLPWRLIWGSTTWRCASTVRMGRRFSSTANHSNPLTISTTGAWRSGNRSWIFKNCRDPNKWRASR